jgi:hypothetical protein
MSEYHKCASENKCKGLGKGIKGYHACAKKQNCKKDDRKKVADVVAKIKTSKAKATIAKVVKKKVEVIRKPKPTPKPKPAPINTTDEIKKLQNEANSIIRQLRKEKLLTDECLQSFRNSQKDFVNWKSLPNLENITKNLRKELLDCRKRDIEMTELRARPINPKEWLKDFMRKNYDESTKTWYTDLKISKEYQTKINKLPLLKLQPIWKEKVQTILNNHYISVSDLYKILKTNETALRKATDHNKRFQLDFNKL